MSGPVPTLLGLLCALVAMPLDGAAQELTSTQFERRSSGESSLQVDVSFGAGEFSLGPAQSGTLYRSLLTYPDEDWTPLHEFANGRLRIGLEGDGSSTLMRQGEQPGMELYLSPTIPQDLELEMGAVRAQMDLGGIALRSLTLATGASETRIRADRPNPTTMDEMIVRVGAASLHGEGIGHLNPQSISIEGGVGEVRLDLAGLTRSELSISASLGLGALEIMIPEGVGVRLTRSGFLSSLHAPFLDRSGDAHYSADWDSADRKVRISVDSALGSVRIVRSGP